MVQGFPEACDGMGLRVRSETYTITALLSMQAHICAEIAPDTVPSFDRVLARYREKAPQCYAATRASPELAAFPESAEAKALIADYRSGAMPEEKRDRLLRECRTIKATEQQRQDERDALEALFPKLPEGTGG